MNLALGTAGVVLGLVASIGAVVTLAVGLLRHRPDLLRLGRVYTWLVLFAAVLAVFAMERALITRDFTVLYVAKNGSTKTPALFNVATMWAALEGSILLWVLFLAGYTALVGWALLTMFVVCVFFFGLLLGPANPFKTFSPPVGYDGPGPNPLLQNNP
ncbi:MAG TPA: heme lyase CcmF/NrfE family subunit, partial [Acidimicrobiales bacterium]